MKKPVPLGAGVPYRNITFAEYPEDCGEIFRIRSIADMQLVMYELEVRDIAGLC